MKKLFTSESVTEGHPAKICDQIADGVLDAILENDPECRVAAEVTVNTGYAMIIGEISTSGYVDINKIAREIICDIGYDNEIYGFDGNTCAVLQSIDEQSGDIAMGVDKAGAGDQGMMFGYACDETSELMPMPISLAHKLAMKLTEVRKNGMIGYLRPDGKTQVTVEYDDDLVKRIDSVIISSQHSEDVAQEQIKKDLVKSVIRQVIPSKLIDSNTKIYA